MNLLQALVNTVLPIFILAGLGWIARTVVKVDVKEPAKLAVYFLVPGLIVNSILGSTLVAAEIGKIIAFGVLLIAAMVALTLLTGRLLGWSASERSASVLGTAFMNVANYGLPVVLFAFGQQGFERAAIFVVLVTVSYYSVGVFFAAHGRMDWKDAVRSIFKLPLIWAAAGAILVRLTGIHLPEVILKPIGLLANGAVVVVVILLGMQVAGFRLKGARLKITVGAVLRLVASPLIGMALVALLKPEPLTAKVLVLESAMPTAVNTTLLAVQFNAEPDLVSGITLTSTLASIATVTFWVWFLQM